MELASIAEAITDYRPGKFVIIVDDESRENEGDLAIAAEKVTPEAINFMATHGARADLRRAARPAARRPSDPADGAARTPPTSRPRSPSRSRLGTASRRASRPTTGARRSRR